MNDFSLDKYYKLLNNKSDIYSDENRDYFSRQSVKFVEWKDHIAEFADVKTEDILGEDEKGRQIVKHIRKDGNIFQQGTPVNAENLGLIDWNIAILDIRFKILQDMLNQIMIQLAIVKNQNANNMPYNSFVASVKNVNEDIEIVEGYYDVINERGVI